MMEIACIIVMTVLIGAVMYAQHVQRMKRIKKRRLERMMVREAIFEMDQRRVQEMFLTVGFHESYRIILAEYKKKHGIEI